jgi:hypothetical protein
MAVSALLIFCRIALGCVFGLSVARKANDLSTFVRAIHRLAVLPAWLSWPAALLLLGGELTVTLLLLAGGPLLQPAFALASLLLVLFCLVLASALSRRVQISCNCFGAGERPISRYTIYRNAGLLCCALGGVRAAGSASASAAPIGALDVVLIGLAALAFVALLLHIAEIVQLFRIS